MKIIFLSIIVIGMIFAPIILINYLSKKNKINSSDELKLKFFQYGFFFFPIFPTNLLVFNKKNIITFSLSLCSILSFVILLYLWGVIGSLYKVKLNLNIDKFEIARAYVFAKTLSKKHPQKRFRALIITGWDSENEELVKVQIEEIKKGLPKSTIIADIKRVKVKKVKKNKYNNGRYIDISSKKFNELITKYTNCNLIISMIGLPSKLHKIKILKQYDKPPIIALLDGRVRRLQPFIRDGRISLITKYRPDWTLLPNLPENPIELFKLRYLIIQKSTMNEMQRRHRFWRNFKWL